MRLSLKLVFQCVAMAILGLTGSLTAFANQSVIVDCRQGGQPVVTSGLTSTTKVLQSYPSCTITVSIHGGGAATIFSDNSGTPLANPFTAQNNPYPGAGFFYAANNRYDITISGAGIVTPITFSDILLNDPATLTGCSQLPALTGDITSAGGTCATVLPNIATPGTGLKTTINAKGQVTANTTAASTDLSDTALIARLNAAANFGLNPITGGPFSGTTASFTTVSDTGETVAGEIAPDITGRQLGDVTHRWDAFLRNVDISGSVTGGVVGGGGTTGTIPKFVAGSTIGNSSLTDNGTNVATSEIFSAASYANNLSAFASTTSSQLLGVISDETGTGALVFANTPALVTPNIGAATGISATLSGNSTLNGLLVSSGISSTKRLRDCGLPGPLGDGVVADGVTNDRVALNNCLANAYAGGQNVQLPSGRIHVTGGAINDTNKPGLAISGVGATEDFSTATAGNDFGTAVTQIMCDTGTTFCWDAIGSGTQQLTNFALRINSSYSTPSKVGFVFGRDNVATNGSASGLGTYCFSANDVLTNIWVFADNIPASTAVGTVAIYNMGAETFTIQGGGFIANLPLMFGTSNVLGLSSTFQTLSTGCPFSMSEVRIPTSNLGAYTNVAIRFDDQMLDFETGPALEIINQAVGTNHTPAINLNAASQMSITLRGQIENFDSDITIGQPADRLNVQMTSVSPTAGLIIFNTGANVTSSIFSIKQQNGAAQPLVNSTSGTASISGTDIFMGTQSGTGTGAANITLTNARILAPGLTNALVNTYKAGSQFEMQTSNGLSYVGGNAHVESTAPTSLAGSDVCYGDSTSHTIKCSYNNGTFGNAVLSAIGNSAASDVSERRFKANQGTAYSGADAAIVLSAGWGTTATKSAAAGFDQAFSFTVTSSGTGQAANPTITITFKDGTWGASPQCQVLRNDLTSPFNTPPHIWTDTATTLTITFNGTPVAANSYNFNVDCTGN